MSELRNSLRLDIADNGQEYDAIVLNGVQYNRAPKSKPKRYVLPMEGTEDGETQAYASYLAEAGVWDVQCNCPVPPRNGARCQVEFTQADIDAAPDWVKAITPVEVTDDEI